VVIALVVQLPAAFLAVRDFVVSAAPGAPLQLAATVALAVVGPLALIAARRFPGPVVAVVSAAAALDLFIGAREYPVPYIALAFAIIGGIARGARVWVWISVATAWVATLIVGAVIGLDWSPFRIAGTTLGILITMGIGEALRTRHERFAGIQRLVEQRRQSEVQAERVRIARELHDVLAHSLSQINVQAGVGLHLMEKHPEKAADALASIKETSRNALDEVRSVLGVLRADGGDSGAPLVPEPDLSRLSGLVASVGTQGLSVTLSEIPEDVPKATQLAIYRIVQESLTNVIRHARATTAVVEIVRDGGDYVVTVTDDGSAAPSTTEVTGGRGLLGMHERAELLGGSLDARPLAAGGFRVRATIPVAPVRSSRSATP
jgi:signal transduction histidine kinase